MWFFCHSQFRTATGIEISIRKPGINKLRKISHINGKVYFFRAHFVCGMLFACNSEVAQKDRANIFAFIIGETCGF